jgi:hypothetical protein
MTRKGKGEAKSKATERSLVAALARDDQKRKGRGKIKGYGEVPPSYGGQASLRSLPPSPRLRRASGMTR